MSDLPEFESLSELPPDRFAAIVAAAFEATFDGELIDRSPPSPDGGVDLLFAGDAGDGGRTLVHARQGRLDAETVRTLAATARARGLSKLAAASTGEFEGTVRSAADGAELDVDTYDASALRRLVDRAELDLDPDSEPTDPVGGDGADPTGAAERSDRPGSDASPPALDDPVERLLLDHGGSWPPEAMEAVRRLFAAVESAARLERTVVRDETATDVEFRPRDLPEPVAKLRLTETSVLLYVRGSDGQFRVVERLAAAHTSRPELDRAAVVDAVADAVARRR